MGQDRVFVLTLFWDWNRTGFLSLAWSGTGTGQGFSVGVRWDRNKNPLPCPVYPRPTRVLLAGSSWFLLHMTADAFMSCACTCTGTHEHAPIIPSRITLKPPAKEIY